MLQTTPFIFCHLTNSFGAFNSYCRKKNIIFSLFVSAIHFNCVPPLQLSFHVSFTLFRFLVCGITDIHIHCIFFNSDIFWHVWSKTTQSPELKYRLHWEIMCALLLCFLPMMSSVSTSLSDCDCTLEWCFYKTVCLKPNIIFPTSGGYSRAHTWIYM